MVENDFLGKVSNWLCAYPSGSKITLAHTVSEINAFLAFYTEIQDGCKNGRKMIPWKNYHLTLQISCGSNFSLKSLYLTSFLDKCIFMFYAGIQDGHQKWQENDFDSQLTLPIPSGIKHFTKITLAHTISNINAFFCILHRNSRWPSKMEGKQFLAKVPVDSKDTLRSKKFCRNRFSLHYFQDKCVLLLFTQKFKMATKNGGKMKMKNNFWEKLLVDSSDTL